VFPVAVNQTRRRWIIFKTFESKTLSNLSTKASEPLINSTYSFFLSIFTIYSMQEIMNSRLFTLPHYFHLGFCLGRIALLSPAVIAFMLSHLSCCKLSYDGLRSSILCDVSGPIVDRCRGLSKVKIWWGRWLPSWFVDGSCLNELRTSSLELTTQDKLCHHVSGMEQLTD
jgi:hypothetical protein